jgi:SulP family sulfate permease
MRRDEPAIARMLPAFGSLRGYSGDDARGDFAGGLSVAAVALPQAMAYALIAGLPVQMGLYTAIVMTSVAALFTSSRQLINGPTNAISIALLGAIAAVSDPAQKIQLAILLAFMVGAIQLVISLARLGDLMRYVSHSVIVGFTVGASALLVLDQLKNLLGQKAAGGVHDHFLVRFWQSATQGGPIHGPTVMVGLGSIAAILLLRWFKGRLGWPLLPEFLIVIIASTWVTWAFHLDDAGVRIIGDIPSGLPRLQAPHFDYALIRTHAGSALAIAMLGLLEAISMSKVISAVTRQKLDLNQQCISEAVGNLAGSFFSCFPGSGSLTRSAINLQAGARTQWAGVISAFAVAVCMLLIAPHARYVPRSALAGLLIVTAFRMVNLKELRYHLRASRFDAILVLVTALSAFAISIEFCVLIGVFMSCLLAVPRTGNILVTEFVDAGDDHVRERLDEDPEPEEILVFGFEGEMFFGSAVSLDNHFERIENRVSGRTRVLVLRMKRARHPDAVAISALSGFVRRMRDRGIEVLLCGVRYDMETAIERIGLMDDHPDRLFLERPVRQTSTQAAMKVAREICAADARA